MKALFDCLPTLPELYPGAIVDLLNHCVRHGRYRMMMRLHGNFPYCLKAGKDARPAPGSVYLEKDNLLMGKPPPIIELFTVAGHGIH